MVWKLLLLHPEIGHKGKLNMNKCTFIIFLDVVMMLLLTLPYRKYFAKKFLHVCGLISYYS